MAVLIKGFKFPKTCRECPFYYPVICMARDENIAEDCNPVNSRDKDCPLVLCEDDRVPATDESLDRIMEEVCEYCRYPFEYKDPDDMEREQCNRCKVAKIVDEVLYGKGSG